ncbi:peptide ABC transporter substrate-binding protein [Lentilactobacillus sp. Marseille-Q4993]|uniref:peptide ABC transporter substrate-binding protein n=1 Tax=Lentilactobacillus sp. Marseille-Q4993 TaxID=3039492 RepID=UPI0024BBEFCB|nr:peptide ABC transporter substrate-binding protein [Lentilactobacillus sp. Marseille-Q4993]
MKKTILIAAATVTVGVALAACSQRGSEPAGKKQEITLMQTGNLTTLDSSRDATLPEFNTLQNTSEGLYKLNKKNQPTPAMATKIVKPTNGGKTYTFNIRKDAKWSNGQDVTATDFVTAWRRAVNPKLEPVYSYVFSGIKNADKVAAGKLPVSKLGIKALGKHKLQIDLDAPMPAFNQLVTMPVFLPQNTAMVKKTGNKFASSDKTFVSNGPFKVAGWTGVNDSYKLTRNKYYYDKHQIKLSQINYRIVKDSNTAKSLFSQNKLDDATLTGVVARGSAKDKDAIHVKRAWTYYLQLNQRKNAPLKNQKLRQAINLAINKDTIADKILADGSKVASSFVSPGVATDPTTGKDFSAEMQTSTKANAKKARQLWKTGLEETGKNKIQLRMVGDDQEITKEIAQYIQSQLERKLPGLEVSIQNLPDKGLQNKKTDGDFDISQWYWLADYADPINYFGVFTKGSPMNSGQYYDKKYQQIINQAKTNAKSEKSYWRDMRNAEKRLQDTTAMVPLYYVSETHLVNPKLKGVMYHVAGEHDYTRAYIK